MSQATDPPPEAVPLHGLPIVERVTPELSRFAEIIRWNSGHSAGHPVRSQLKKLRAGPDIDAIHGDIDGKISQKKDVPFASEGTQPRPLTEEEKLPEDMDFHLTFQPSALLPEGLGIAVSQQLRPKIPGKTAHILLERHEERKILDPVPLIVPETMKGLYISPTFLKKPHESPSQQAAMQESGSHVIDPP